MIRQAILQETASGTLLQSADHTTKDAFNHCITPMSEKEFTHEYWEQKPYVLSRGNKQYYEDLFTGSDFSSILENSRFGATEIRIVSKGQQSAFSEYAKPDGRLDTGRVSELYLNGYSVVMHSVENFNRSVAAFTQSIRQFFSAKVFVNAYLTPKGSQALKAHYDNHDVLILQIEGSKKWNLYHSAMDCPLDGSFQPSFSKEELPEPREIRLEKGDFMYVPRGWVHDAAATEESSLHLTVGIHPTQWVDFLTKAMQALSYTHLPLRRALPPGFLKDPTIIDTLQQQLEQLALALKEKGSAAHAYNAVQSEFLQTENISGDGSLIGILDNLSEITLATAVYKRSGISTRLIRTSDTVNLEFNNAKVQAPHSYLEAFSFISSITEEFLVADIPGLPEAKKIPLVQRLVRDGLLLPDNL